MPNSIRHERVKQLEIMQAEKQKVLQMCIMWQSRHIVTLLYQLPLSSAASHEIQSMPAVCSENITEVYC